jgi:hypothetical protein
MAAKAAHSPHTACFLLKNSPDTLPVTLSTRGDELAINENLSEVKGQPVVDWSAESDGVDLSRNAIRIRIDYQEADDGISIGEKFASLLEAPGIERLQSLIIGAWQEMILAPIRAISSRRSCRLGRN